MSAYVSGTDGFDFHLEKQGQVCPVPVHFDNFRDSFDSTAILEALERAITSAESPITALIITNPHNPLGQCYSEDNLLTFAKFCGRHDLHLVSDEVYALSTFVSDNAPDTSSAFVSALSLDLASAKCKESRVHVVWSMSKDLACSGLRIVGVFGNLN